MKAMTTAPSGSSRELAIPEGLPVEESLFYYDFDLFYASKDKDGNPLLVYYYDETEVADVFLVTPLTQQRLDAIKNRELSIYDALDQPVLWRVEMVGAPANWVVRQLDGLSSLPRDTLPNQDVMLRP